MKQYLIAAEIMAADIFSLIEEVEQVLLAGANMLYIEIDTTRTELDLALGFMAYRKLRYQGVSMPTDVCLRGDINETIMHSLSSLSVRSVFIYPDSVSDVSKALLSIKKFGCKSGLVLTAQTPLTPYVDSINYIDQLLVAPSKEKAERSIEEQLQVVTNVNSLLGVIDSDVRLAVTGAQQENITQFAIAGADTFIVSNAIFGGDDYHTFIARLRQKAFLGSNSYIL